ncbi:MAG: 4Fe-4S binding protein [Spirochaetaceae bacterium]|nr:MAG: 4Fe-4S binding protein [Spirochaetaceae bacterium]
MIDDSLIGFSSGIVSLDELRKLPVYPSEERFLKGPVPIIECVEEIPCNPCQTVCNRKAIRVGEPITNLPVLVDSEACSGCGQCVVVCPGLAIFIVDKTFSDTLATIMLPFEFLPLPSKGEAIIGINRAGKWICRGYVQEVQNRKSFDRTSVVTIAVPKEHADEVRFFRIAP